MVSELKIPRPKILGRRFSYALHLFLCFSTLFFYFLAIITMSQSENSTIPNGVNESAETITTNSGSLFSVNMTNVTKLVPTNYLMWSRQVHALFDGYDLAAYLDGSKLFHAATITTDGVSSPNPEFVHCKRQDKLIYSALLGAMSTSIQPLLSRANSAAEIWTQLASTYAKPSRGHIRQLKVQLKHWKKDAKTVDVYVQGLITRFDELALLGKPLDHEDQVEIILDGLPDDTDPSLSKQKAVTHH